MLAYGSVLLDTNMKSVRFITEWKGKTSDFNSFCVAFYLGLFLFRVNIFFARLNTAKITCVPHKRFVNSKNGVQTGFLSTKESQTDLATNRCIVQKFHTVVHPLGYEFQHFPRTSLHFSIWQHRNNIKIIGIPQLSGERSFQIREMMTKNKKRWRDWNPGQVTCGVFGLITHSATWYDVSSRITSYRMFCH